LWNGRGAAHASIRQDEEARPLHDVERIQQGLVRCRHLHPPGRVVEASPGEVAEGPTDDGAGDDAEGQVPENAWSSSSGAEDDSRHEHGEDARQEQLSRPPPSPCKRDVEQRDAKPKARRDPHCCRMEVGHTRRQGRGRGRQRFFSSGFIPQIATAPNLCQELRPPQYAA
jgi:hypothetical protein